MDEEGVRRLNEYNLLTIKEPTLHKYFIASAAWTDATTPAAGPITPFIAQGDIPHSVEKSPNKSVYPVHPGSQDIT